MEQNEQLRAERARGKALAVALWRLKLVAIAGPIPSRVIYMCPACMAVRGQDDDEHRPGCFILTALAAYEGKEP